MISLFQNKTFPFLGITVDARSEYGLNQMRVNISRLHEYMRARNFTVPNQHPLVGILHRFAIPLEYDIMRAHDLAYERAAKVGRTTDLVSISGRGKPWLGVFFGGDNQEMVLAVADYHPLEKLIHGWGDLEPVKVHYHPWSDFSMVPPNGTAHRSVTGDVYLSVDISMLLMMYYCWQQKQLKNNSLIMSASVFVASYVLPNMLSSYIDVCVVNMYRDIIHNQPRTTSSGKLPFHVPDVSNLIRHDIKKVIDTTSVRSPLDAILRDIPAVGVESALEAMRLPRIPRVTQLWWWVLGAKLPVLLALLNNPKLVRANMHYVGEIKIALRTVANDGTLTGLPKDLTARLTQQLNQLADLTTGV